jgi:hypothetical protein
MKRFLCDLVRLARASDQRGSPEPIIATMTEHFQEWQVLPNLVCIAALLFSLRARACSPPIPALAGRRPGTECSRWKMAARWRSGIRQQAANSPVVAASVISRETRLARCCASALAPQVRNSSPSASSVLQAYIPLAFGRAWAVGDSCSSIGAVIVLLRLGYFRFSAVTRSGSRIVVSSPFHPTYGGSDSLVQL